MPQRIFLAHSRNDRTAVAELVRAMRALGYAVALDDLLPGGAGWWSKVLERIERCEVFAYAVSGASLDSEACKAQHRYASSLGIPALPIVVGQGVADALVPPELARLQRVDYRSASKQAMAELYRSIESLEAPSLRAVEAPAVPHGFELDLTAAIDVDYLDPDTQSAIVGQLERLVGSGAAQPELRDVLSTLRARNDLTVRADEKLAALSAVGDRTGPAPRLASDAIPPEPAQQRRGARRVFVSYSRSDVEPVGVLAEDLREAGFDVWLDRELPGGIEWWNEILRRIRECDAFVVAVSAASRASRACAAELEYARAVKRPVLRVSMESSEASGGDVTYLAASADELAGVISALRRAHAPEVPATLPPPPQVPASYLFDTRTEIRTPRVLKPSEQMALIEQLGHHLEGDISPRDILQLTAELRSRDDLTVEAARAVGAIEEKAEAAAARSGDTPEAAPVAAPAPQTEEVESAGEDGNAEWEAASPPPEPAAARVDEAGPTPTKRPRRPGRRVAAAAGILAVAVAGMGVVRSALSGDGRSDPPTPTATTSRSTRVDPGTTAPSTPPETGPDADVEVQGITGTVSFSWVVNGVTYAATLTTDGKTGFADVGFFDSATGVNMVIREDVRLEHHDHGWAWVGSNPRFPDGSSAFFYSPDEFWLEPRNGLWYVVNVCDAAGFCAPTA